tara:strand:- start:438 stop:1517 length:1080 start_codon:yes stop_codon:yes gene_type:complete
MARALVLLNLGTPDSTDVKDVRDYLKEFLSDPRVLDINPVARFLLLHLVILRKRPAESAAAYRKIWTERGSPLLFNSLDLAEKVQELMGEDTVVELAMRYRNPSIRSVLEGLKDRGINDLVLFPLFPQYSSAAWGSGVEKFLVEARRLWDEPSVKVVPPYYDHPAFIDAFCDVARPILADQRPDKVLMSFHGIPQRHVRTVFKGQPERDLLGVDGAGGDHCLEKPDCCAEICPANRNCYSAHCYATARSLAAGLELSPGSWEVSFQSRLGREPWLEPYTDFRIEELPGEGVEKLAVFSPAFTADCLETVEEIGLRARDDFLAAGGKDLRLIPSLNAESSWVEAVVRIVADTTLANEVQD